jgi:vancomycin resistance protein VanJ
MALGLLAWNVLRWYPGDRWLPVRLGNYFAPWLLVAASVGLCLAALGRRRWLSGLLGILVLILGGRYWPVLTPQPVESHAHASSHPFQLRVMTFNVHYSNRDAAGIAGLVRSQAPDLIAFQEFTRPLGLVLIPQLAAEYPYTLVDDEKWTRQALLSRYPLTDVPPPPAAWRTQRARVQLPGSTLTVWNVHAMPAIAQRGWEEQRQALTAVAQQLLLETGPLLVMGDFNTTDQNENYHLVADQLIDVQRAVGWGFGFTFPDSRPYFPALPNLGPLLRIDHIFVSEDWLPLEIHVVPDGHSSDHLPLVATLAFNGSAPDQR